MDIARLCARGLTAGRDGRQVRPLLYVEWVREMIIAKAPKTDG